jgi:DNA-binding NarL/FixJ family response regulator
VTRERLDRSFYILIVIYVIAIISAMTVHATCGNALTPKEIQIGILVRRCLRNRDIAQSLGISEQDVKNRLRGIFDKVGVWSRVELAMHAVEHPERWHAEGAGRQ